MKKIPGVSLSNCIFSTSDSSSRTCGIYPTNSLHAKKPWRVAKREQAIHVFSSSIQGGAEDVSGGHGWSWGDHRAVNSRPGAAVPPREDHSLPEAGPAGAAERQSCREMKSELAQLGLQGRISVPINNSGIPWGREDDIISHPFPITTLPLPSLFPIIPLHPKSWGHLGTMLCHPPQRSCLLEIEFPILVCQRFDQLQPPREGEEIPGIISCLQSFPGEFGHSMVLLNQWEQFGVISFWEGL